MKILHVVPGLGLGGAEALLFELVSRQREFDHSVVCLGGRGWFSDRLEALRVPVDHLHIGSYWAAATGFAALRRLIERRRPAVIQSWLYSANLMAGLAGRIAGVPVVWGIHTSSLNPLPITTRAIAHLNGFLAPWIADFVINCSTRSAELHRSWGYERATGKVIHNGYDQTRFFADEAAREATRREIGIRPETFLIGAIARWHPQKDIPNLLNALRLLSKRGADFTCVLLGHGLGPQNKALAREISDAGCTPYVMPLGPRSDVDALARSMDIHVLASCGGEAFPNVVAETMLAEVPNVVTNVGDSSLMVGETGWVVSPGDSASLAEAIEKARREWSDQPEAWQRRGSAARARARIADSFSFDANALPQRREFTCSFKCQPADPRTYGLRNCRLRSARKLSCEKIEDDKSSTHPMPAVREHRFRAAMRLRQPGSALASVTTPTPQAQYPALRSYSLAD